MNTSGSRSGLNDQAITPEAMKCLLLARLRLAERLLKEDISDGKVPLESTRSFVDLHEVTDPNCYVSDDHETITEIENNLLKDYKTEDWINYWETLVQAMDSWLSSKMHGEAAEYLSDETIMKNFF